MAEINCIKNAYSSSNILHNTIYLAEYLVNKLGNAMDLQYLLIYNARIKKVMSLLPPADVLVDQKALLQI